jgi:hypothetical protein
LLIAAALAAAGCGPRDAEVRRQRLAAERRRLEGALDELQVRLLANQARVRLWQELRARHESVSAIACASMDEHAAEMARRLLPLEPPERTARRPLRQARIAAIRPAERPPPSSRPEER